MFADSTDRDWEALGAADPFWAVLSHGAYRQGAMSDEDFRRFLQTGADHVDAVWQTCQRLFGADFAPRRALDFGCGVGRVTLPLARRVDQVVGADVAGSMLTVATRLMAAHGAGNVRLVACDDTLASIDGLFDLVHSVLVLQHIPPARGLGILRRLIDLAAPGGTLVLDVLYHNPLRRSWPIRWAHRIARPLRRFRHPLPEIQMNAYPLNAVMTIVHEGGARRANVELASHAGHLVATLYFQKR